MLVISRKQNEAIYLKDSAGNVIAKMRVVRIGPNSARLGIEAPPEINVVREELLPAETPGAAPTAA